jgi:hypothetical protein
MRATQYPSAEASSTPTIARLTSAISSWCWVSWNVSVSMPIMKRSGGRWSLAGNSVTSTFSG